MEFAPKVAVRIGTTLAEIDRVEARLAKYATRKSESTVSVDGREALARVAEIQAALTIIGHRNVTAEVKVKIKSALADLTALRREIDHTVAGGIGAKPLGGLLRDVENVGLKLERVGAEAATFASRVANGLLSVGSSVAGVVSAAGDGIGRAVVRSLELTGAALVIVIPLIALAAPFVLSLVGALGALVAVFVAAAAGAGALGIALVAAFGPVAAVIAFVVYQINQVVEAQKKQAAAIAAAKNALVSQQQAQANLARAQANQVAQRLAALDAEKGAVLALANAENGMQHAGLDVEGAKLRLEQARAALSDFQKQSVNTSLVGKFKDVATSRLPGALDGVIKAGGAQAQGALDYKQKLFDVKTALQGVKDSELSVKNAQDVRSHAQATLNAFQTKGLKAFDGYKSALQQTDDAERSLNKATTTLVESERKRDQILGSLTPTQAKFAAELKGIGKALREDLGPAGDAVFGALTDALGHVTDLLDDPSIQLSLRDIGNALAFVIRTLGDEIDTKGFKSAFSELAKGGADLTRVFGGKVLPDLLRLLLAIAREALPDLESGSKGLAGWFHGFVDAELHGHRLHDQIQFVVGALKSVAHFGGSAIDVLIKAFPQATTAGEKLLGMATKFLRKLKDTLGTAEGQGKLRKFFSNSVSAVEDLVNALKVVAAVINGVNDALRETVKLVKIAAAPIGAVNGLSKSLGLGNPLKQLLKIIPFGANGGIATGPVIAGEAGHEALIPLRSDVLSRLAHAITAYMPDAGSLLAAGVPSVAHSGGGRPNQTNYLNINAPPGEWPDIKHALAEIKERLAAIGA